ncbi:hypothetical protein [Aquimarina algicola]|uniref:PKD domain-containing protein n=1 Tax=Aquimarina algicola TaxID=2589995 RepID=A0A504J9M2_9FLAO|nr:hypothetical protein [Aquimarina algicola]TPN85295.1 hypothetical protein FHK87_14845 [Aquimarina algicola]
MKKLNLLFLFMLLSLGFISCEGEVFENCPTVEFTVEKRNDLGSYQFTSSVNTDDTVYSWYINDVLIDNARQNVFEYNFLSGQSQELSGAGEYEVCLKVQTSDCENGSELYCETITVTEPDSNCPQVFFTMEAEPGTQIGYGFMAKFETLETVTSFAWTVNNEEVELSNNSQENDRYFYREFTPGESYTVCLTVVTPDCQEGASYCKEFVAGDQMNDGCSELTIAYEKLPNSDHRYAFTAEDNTNQATEYRWFLNGNLLLTPNQTQFIDNLIEYELQSGTYEICAIGISEACPEGSEKFCKTITIEGCPQLAFDYQKTNGNYTYNFYPAVSDTNIMDHVVVEWFVNQQYVGNSSDLTGDTPFLYQFDQAGTYEVCIAIETPDCPNGTRVCKTINVEENNTCRTPVFDYYPTQNVSNSYQFSVRMDENFVRQEYRWFLEGQPLLTPNGSPYTDNLIEYQLQPGTYSVCVVATSAQCPNGQEFCKTITVPSTDQ